MNFFNECNTIDEVKALYRVLFAENCKNTEIMNVINLELKTTLAALQQFNNVQSEVQPVTEATEKEDKRQQLISAANFAKSLDDKLKVEIANLWVWVSGVTREDKELQIKLHNYGFKYAYKKSEWYYHNMQGFRTRKELTRDQIRIKYGNEPIQEKMSF